VSENKTTLKPINTPVYRYWEALYLSFYSKNLFIDVGKRWRGLGLGYLMMVLAILAIPFSLMIGVTFNTFFNEQFIEPLLQLPTIYVQKGQASIDKPVPYIIKNSKQQVVLIVDTSDTITKFNNEYPHLNILLNKEKMSYRIPTPQLFKSVQPQEAPRIPMTQEYGKNANSVFDGKKLVSEGTFSGLKYTSLLMIYPIVISVLFSFFIVMFPVFALLGQVFGRVFFSFQLTYAQACRLLIVSATPMLLILLTLLPLNIVFPGMGIILIALMATYFSYALTAVKRDSSQVARV